jgi:hypothetical protein
MNPIVRRVARSRTTGQTEVSLALALELERISSGMRVDDPRGVPDEARVPSTATRSAPGPAW